MSLFIVIPAYNEEKRIGSTLKKYSEFFERKRIEKKLDYEMFIVLNNTKDKTEQIVEEWSKVNGRIRHINLKKKGKGYAIIEGFKEALKTDKDLIGFVDADMSTLPDQFYDLFLKIGSADGVIASRYMKGSKITPKPSKGRLIAKSLFNMCTRALLFLPYKDTQCGAKLFRRRAIELTLGKITMSSWAFDVDLLYTMKKLGLHIREIPTIWSDKEYSKINFWRAGPWMVLAILRLRILNSKISWMIRAYDKAISWFPKVN